MAEAEQLARVVDRVRHDVRVTLGDDAVRIDLAPGTEPEILIATTELRPTLTGAFTHPGESEEQLCSRVASTVQDCVVESRRYFGRAWPPCPVPSHQHPLHASDRAPGHWVCPATQDVIAPIGELEHP